MLMPPTRLCPRFILTARLAPASSLLLHLVLLVPLKSPLTSRHADVTCYDPRLTPPFYFLLLQFPLVLTTPASIILIYCVPYPGP